MNEITLTLRCGALRIPFSLATEEIKKKLTYKAKEMATEEYSYVDGNGVRHTGFRNTKRIITRTYRMYREGKEGEISTYDGFLGRVRDILIARGMSGILIQRLEYSAPIPIINRSIVRGLKDDQKLVVIDALSQVWDGENHLAGGAVVDATMGYGKTYLIAALCRAYRGSGVVVTTKSATVVRRLVTGLKELLKDDGITVGTRQGAKFKNGDVVVCTNAVLDRFDPDATGCLIYDEVHHAAAPLQTKALTKFHNSVKFGLSGTVVDRFDGRHHLIEGIFGGVCSVISDEQAEELGRVVPLKIFVAPVERGPNISDIKSPISAERRAIWRNPTRNKIIAEVAEKVPPEWQTIVFVRTLEHAKILAEKYLPEGFELFHSDLPADEYTRILEGFESGDLLRIVSTDAMGEGVDPSNLRVVIDANWTSSNVKVSQRAGRCRRKAPGKTVGYIVTFDDRFDNQTKRKSATRISVYRDRGYEILRPEHHREISFLETPE